MENVKALRKFSQTKTPNHYISGPKTSYLKPEALGRGLDVGLSRCLFMLVYLLPDKEFWLVPDRERDLLEGTEHTVIGHVVSSERHTLQEFFHVGGRCYRLTKRIHNSFVCKRIPSQDYTVTEA